MELLVPIFICCELPIAIVAIVFWSRINADNKRSQVLIKAIDANNNIDADKLAEALRQPRKTAKEILHGRLLKGCIFSLGGLACMIMSVINYLNREPGSSMDSVEIPGLCGGIMLALGISFLIVYFVTRKQLPEKED